jgi:molybdopterin-guanine dinucleotide biosynthesis protein A
MDGVDKEGILVGGRTLAERAVAAVADAQQVIAVGRPLPGARNVREEPPGSGPVAAIAAGLAHVEVDVVVVLATDLPFVTGAAVGLLVAGLAADADASGAFPIDGEGRDQPLCGAWRADRLRAALAALGDVAGASVRSLVARAGPVVRLRDLGSAAAPPWFDCDTPADLAEAEQLLRPELGQHPIDGGDARLA